MNDSMNFWQSKRFGSTVFILAIAGIVFLAVLSLNALRESVYIGRDVVSQNVITVSGEGEAFAKPDTATFSFTVEEDAKVVADAQKAVDAKTKSALDFLKKSNIAEKDTKTVSYQIYPNYEYAQPVVCTPYSCPPQNPPKINGYKVSQTIEVKIRDIEKAGELLSGIGAVGVTNLSGLNFTVDDEDAVQAKAREEAITKAEAKAKELSNQLGVRLVRIVNFSESGNYPVYYYGKTMTADGRGGAEMAASPSVSVAPGETRIVSNVTITYEIR